MKPSIYFVETKLSDGSWSPVNHFSRWTLKEGRLLLRQLKLSGGDLYRLATYQRARVVK